MPYTRPSFLRLRAFPEEGQRCCLAESLVWSVGVVDILPSAKKLVDLGERGGRCKAVVELLLGEFKSPDGTYRPRDVQPEVPHTRYNARVRHLSERDQTDRLGSCIAGSRLRPLRNAPMCQGVRRRLLLKVRRRPA